VRARRLLALWRDPRFLVDEHINSDFVMGSERLVPGIDVASVQNVGRRTADHPTILEQAASQGRVLITRDVKTIPSHAFERVSAMTHLPPR
jgi:predicted nuclease of predicted toxin-antitoxin system